MAKPEHIHLSNCGSYPSWLQKTRFEKYITSQSSRFLLFCPHTRLANLVLLLRFECLGALVRWSGDEGSAVELGRERPAPGRQQLGSHVWRPGMDGRSPETQRDLTGLFSLHTSV